MFLGTITVAYSASELFKILTKTPWSFRTIWLLKSGTFSWLWRHRREGAWRWRHWGFVLVNTWRLASLKQMLIALSSSGLVTNQYLITKSKEHNPIAYYDTEVNLILMAMWHSRQDPSSWPGIEPSLSVLKVWSLNRWTTMDIQANLSLDNCMVMWAIKGKLSEGP